MNTQELIIKRAAMKVEAAMKGAEMIKEIPGQVMSTIQDEIDPETIDIIERLLSQGNDDFLKTGAITIHYDRYPNSTIGDVLKTLRVELPTLSDIGRIAKSIAPIAGISGLSNATVDYLDTKYTDEEPSIGNTLYSAAKGFAIPMAALTTLMTAVPQIKGTYHVI